MASHCAVVNVSGPRVCTAAMADMATLPFTTSPMTCFAEVAEALPRLNVFAEVKA